MATRNDELKTVRQRKYLARDFDGLRAQLLEYARTYYPDKINDFSESSLGGLFLDFAAYTGDVLSFYLDHQFGELNADTAVETVNIERIIKSAGVPILGASPAVAPVTIYVQVPAEIVNNTSIPAKSALPIVQSGSVFGTDSGVEFVLLEDVNFNKKRADGTLLADVKIGQTTPSGVPKTYVLALVGLCVSGTETTESFPIGETFVPFRKITLSNANVSEIMSVTDGYGNIYYQVNALTHDVVYKNVLNTQKDNDLVKDSIKVVPAPYRYTVDVNLQDRSTTLTFGGGNADTFEDDVIPDPSDFAISFPYTKTFSRIPVNPQKLLQTKTLGSATTSTILQITYRYGGGLNHNAQVGAISVVKLLKTVFPNSPSAAVASITRNSIEVSNLIPASGGEDSPTADDLLSLAPSVRNSQERIVSKEDLISRIYTMPSNFGRVFRAAVRSNPNNPLATQLFIVSRDTDSKLILSPDSLKLNLRTYLNPYRMISDAIDILDARVINLTVSFDILTDPMMNRNVVLQNVLTSLQGVFDIKNFHIDQPIITSEIVTGIYAIAGVISVTNVSFQNISSTNNGRKYSDEVYDIQTNTRSGIIFPPEGGIFEIRYPEYDIVGKALT